MKRGRINAVTEIPVLVTAEVGERWWPATFLTETGRPIGVRIFGESDNKRALRRLREDQKAHLFAVLELAKALQRNDSLALRKARDRFAAAFQKRREHDEKIGFRHGDTGEPSFARMIARIYGFGRGREAEAVEIHKGYRLTEREMKDARCLLSRQISAELPSVQFVLWWNGRYFTPALYCPTPDTALYVRALLGFAGGAKTMGICPHCGALFIPERSDQQYCSIAHREAHRVARWRQKKRARGKTRGEKSRARR